MEDIEDGEVWYKEMIDDLFEGEEVMLKCWKAQPGERPHIRSIRKRLESLYSHHDEESSVTNEYIQLTANIEPSPARDSPVVINPGYQDKTKNDRGCCKWLPNAAKTVTFKWLVGLLLLAIVGGTIGK